MLFCQKHKINPIKQKSMIFMVKLWINFMWFNKFHVKLNGSNSQNIIIIELKLISGSQADICLVGSSGNKMAHTHINSGIIAEEK